MDLKQYGFIIIYPMRNCTNTKWTRLLQVLTKDN